jgi:hypothetical protein
MKISDILGRKNEQKLNQSLPDELERLNKQKQEIENVAEAPDETMIDPSLSREDMETIFNDNNEPMPMPPLKQQRQIPQPPLPTTQAFRQQQPMQQQQPTITREQLQQDPRIGTFALDIVMDTGDAIPVVIEVDRSQIPSILTAIDLAIENKRVLTIGGFKIPGGKILFIKY